MNDHPRFSKMAIDYDRLARELETLAANPPADLLKNEAMRHRLAAAAQAVVPRIEASRDTIQRVNYTPLELTMARIGSDIGLFEKLSTASRPVSTDEISKEVEGDPATLDRFFRHMANLYMIEEIGPSVWGPTEVTKTLAQPLVAGGLVHNFDTIVPALLALPGWLKDRKYQSTWDPNDTAFARSHDSASAFQWLPQNPPRMQAMGMWMTIHKYAHEVWLDSFPFEKEVLANLKDQSRAVFVDVGGGVGHQCQVLLQRFPSLKERVILQDLPQALTHALEINGMKTQPIDFFKDQPIKGAKSYYLRSILHDWPDNKCLEILATIKAAMALDSVLLIDEIVIPVKGSNKLATQSDLTMLINLAGEERSETRWDQLFSQAGFKITNLYTYQKEIGDCIIMAKTT